MQPIAPYCAGRRFQIEFRLDTSCDTGRGRAQPRAAIWKIAIWGARAPPPPHLRQSRFASGG
eukprot:1648167-Pyramimonas_sp.AAC.1